MSAPPLALVKKIRDTLENASDAMLDEARERGFPVYVKPYRDGRYENPTAVLKSSLTSIYRDLRMLAEVMGQNECLEDIKRYDFAHSSKYGDVNYNPEYDDVYATGLIEANHFLESLVDRI